MTFFRLEKELGTMFKSKAPLIVTAQLEKEIVANGEDAGVNVKIDNKSPR